MRASIALEPKSHCDSRTPITGDAQSRVSVSLGSQSCADAESDQERYRTECRAKASSGVRAPQHKISNLGEFFDAILVDGHEHLQFSASRWGYQHFGASLQSDA
jgi:hypothetical protein